MTNIVAYFSAQAGRIRANINELYTLALITFGVPAVFYLYIDWKAALVAFLVTQIPLGILRERS